MVNKKQLKANIDRLGDKEIYRRLMCSAHHYADKRIDAKGDYIKYVDSYLKAASIRISNLIESVA